MKDKKKKPEETIENEETLANEETLEIDYEKEIEKLKQENEILTNDYLRAYADAENYKKRMQREKETLLKYRIQTFALEILPVLDNLERALEVETTDEAFRNGVQMIYEQLCLSLSKEGVEPIEALEQEFDPNYHQAMSKEKVEGVEPNIVIEEFQKGYRLKDRVLRASMVKVSE